ncbi:50S ribosomal protein L30 [Anaerofustis stercorihominis]|uniref:50S ribosomal protein L30 n=1 Tax=Anaerofustis TaxID=264995 RepID=UPI0011074937|nr:50S ribosomal protein L30 [Anaerofustis stercorihominis]MCO8194587.1 50S ribosomal protein L30 [Anaerofustis sp. NSJ-163]
MRELAGEKQLKITLKKSLIGRNEKQRRSIEALGLRKIGQSVVKQDNPQMRGICQKMDFMLDVEEI